MQKMRARAVAGSTFIYPTRPAIRARADAARHSYPEIKFARVIGLVASDQRVPPVQNLSLAYSQGAPPMRKAAPAPTSLEDDLPV